MKIRSIVVDDDARSRQTIIHDLEHYCPQIEIVAQADSVKSAVHIIKEEKPEILFLDIELGDGTGFDIIESCKGINFKVIFVTAHGSYGIKAIKFSALDYLEKPVDPEDLQKAVEKYIDSEKKHDGKDLIEYLLSNLTGKYPQFKQIVLQTDETSMMVNLQDIIYCKSDKNYTEFKINGQEKKELVSKTLGMYEDLFSEYNFFRVHNSYLINLRHFNKYEKRVESIIMSDGSNIPLAQRRKEDFKKQLKKLSI